MRVVRTFRPRAVRPVIRTTTLPAGRPANDTRTLLRPVGRRMPVLRPLMLTLTVRRRSWRRTRHKVIVTERRLTQGSSAPEAETGTVRS